MNKKGFTLVELMIVGAILGILMAIIIPQFKSCKNKDDNINQGPSVIRESNQEKVVEFKDDAKVKSELENKIKAIALDFEPRNQKTIKSKMDY